MFLRAFTIPSHRGHIPREDEWLNFYKDEVPLLHGSGNFYFLRRAF